MKKLLLVLLAAAVMLTPAVAQAGAITATFLGGSGVTAYWNAGANSIGTQAGEFQIKVTDATGLEGLPAEFKTFCVDLQHTVVSPTGATLDKMSNWNIFADTTAAGKLAASFLLTHYFANGVGTYGAAAYQIAIWEALYEETGVFNVNSGSAYFTGTVPTAANDLLALAITGNKTNAGWLRTSIPGTNSDGQDFGAPPVSVPDGGMTLMLLGGALMGLGALRRKLQ